METFDGWALSAGNNLASWRVIMPLLPDGVRVCAWVKPFASFKPNVTLAYAWEPIFIKPSRAIPRTEPTCRDWVAENITLKKGLAGAKPPAVCRWLFRAMGADKSDTFLDMYPGTEIVGNMWNAFCGNVETQGDLFPPRLDALI